MAVNVSVYDLVNYPDNPKTVTVDIRTIVPLGYEGDEQWVLSFVTTAYSDNTTPTAIQDIYVQETSAGWLKSSGFVGTGGRFTIDSSTKQLGIKIDASAGPSGGSGYYTISLSEGENLTGESIASDMEEKIRALPDDASWNTSDDGYKLAYLAATVEYKNGKFWIISGSISSYYTGANRSSVKVYKITGDACFETLGFDLSVDSQTIAGTTIKEVLLASNYTGGNATMSVNTGLGVSEGDALAITDGTNTHYFTAISGTTESSLKLAIQATNGFDAIPSTTTYSGSVSKVQKLTLQDPENRPVSYYTNVDDIVRWGIKSIVNQVDFS